MLETNTGQIGESLSRPTDPTPTIKPLGSAHAPKPKPYFPSWKLRAQELRMTDHAWIHGGYEKDGWVSPYVVRYPHNHDLKDFSN